jgi:hypothetical protein
MDLYILTFTFLERRREDKRQKTLNRMVASIPGHGRHNKFRIMALS